MSLSEKSQLDDAILPLVDQVGQEPRALDQAASKRKVYRRRERGGYRRARAFHSTSSIYWHGGETID